MEVSKIKLFFDEKKITKPIIQPTAALEYEANLIRGNIRPEQTKMHALINNTLAMTKGEPPPETRSAHWSGDIRMSCC